MGIGMLAAMAFIVPGVIAASYGLLPPECNELATLASAVRPEDAPLTKAHWFQIVLVGIALIVDVMKAATLGFVTPCVRAKI
jgi:putative MFS transporter